MRGLLGIITLITTTLALIFLYITIWPRNSEAVNLIAGMICATIGFIVSGIVLIALDR